MKRQTFTNLSREALHELLREKQVRLQELRFLRKVGKVKNSAEFSSVRKDIARIRTHLHEM